MEKLKEATLYEKLENKRVKCNLCSFHCTVEEGRMGICKTRANKNGVFYALSYGRAYGYSIEPIEKKPFYHYKPGSKVLSFGTPGCNFSCLNCQNYFMSQSTKEIENAYREVKFTAPKEIVTAGENADGFAYTYTEPTIFYEYFKDCVEEQIKEKKEKFNVWVSNGYYSKQLLNEIMKEKKLDAARIDLKFVSNENYAKVCKASLKPVIENIKGLAKSKVFIELINLVIPGFNDTEEQITELTELIKGIDKKIPLHFLRFYPYYKMQGVPSTPDETLEKALKIGRENLEYVYAGNASIKGGEDTHCPECGKTLIKRRGMDIIENVLTEPFCPKCGREINLII